MNYVKSVPLVCLLIFLFLTGACADKVFAQDEFLNARSMFHDYYDARGVSYDQAYNTFGQDNASVACYVASQARVGLQDVHRVYSASGNNWGLVLGHFNINPSGLFLPVPSNYTIGPPYGNAYGYWKKHQKSPSSRIVLSSNDIVNLVNMNVIHVQLGTAVIDIMQYRASNQTFPLIVNREYQRIGKGSYKVNYPHYDDNNQGSGKGHGNGHDNGQSSGKGHGNDHDNDDGQGHGQGHGNPKKK
jgi:hypothetical protein